MGEVFISYKSDDNARVVHLRDALVRAGFSTWWDRDIPPGKPWEISIEKALLRAELVLVVWTHGSVHSVSGRRVQDEAREALDSQKLVQVLIDPVKPPLFFRHFQALDLRHWDGKPSGLELNSLVEEVARRLSGSEPTLSGPSNPFVSELVEKNEFLESIVLKRNTWIGDAIPPPRSGEDWSVIGRVRAPRSIQLSPLKFKRSEIDRWCWLNTSIKMIGHIDHGHTRVFSGAPNKTSDANELFQFRRPYCIRTLDSCSDEASGWIAMSDVRRISLVSLFYGCSVSELMPDGTVNTHRYAGTSRLKYTLVESRHQSGDFYHDLGQVLSVSPSGDILAFYYGDLEKGAETGSGWTLRFWYTKRYENEPIIRDIELDTGKYGKPDRLIWAPSSDFLIASNGYTNTIIDAKSGDKKLPNKIDNRWYRGYACWHPTQPIFAQAYTEDMNMSTWTIEIIDANSLETLYTRNTEHSRDIIYLAWGSDGRFIAVASGDRSVSIWDLKHNEIKRLYGATGEPNYLEFSPDSSRLAIFGLGKAKECSIWDPSDGRELVRFPGSARNCSSNVWNRTGRQLAYQVDPDTIEVVELTF